MSKVLSEDKLWIQTLHEWTWC